MRFTVRPPAFRALLSSRSTPRRLLFGLAAAFVVMVVPTAAEAACSQDAPNGVGNVGEQCDDGNSNDADGCSNSCAITSGYACACPAGQLTGVTVDDPQQLLAVVGGEGGGAFADRCPAGQVTIGFDYTLGDFVGSPNWLSSSRARCASLSIEGTTVTITAAGTTPSRGQGGGSSSSLVCPAGSVVAGYRGESRNVDGFVGAAGVQLYCAELTVGSDGRVQVGTPTAGPQLTPGGGTITSIGPSLCPAGSVVSGNEGKSGVILDKFTMLCQRVYTNCAAATTCAAVCGDGAKVGAEACDDGDTDSFDGCSATCAIEPGFSCPTAGQACVQPCGNGVLTAGETCDDGGNAPGDGCSAACGVEEGWACENTSEELIVNGDFSAGNSGFTTEYELRTSGAAAEGVYEVTNDALAFHFDAPSDFRDQGGDGYAMFFNGTAGLVAYEARVPVVAGRTYNFTAYASSWTPGAPAILSFSMNGTAVTAPVALPGETGVWVRVSGAYAATASGEAVVRIVNSQPALGGNDFVLDSISVREATTSRCQTVCGDGLKTGAEACDDQDSVSGDGCSSTCTVEDGWSCNGDPSFCAPTCGDSLVIGNEDCDDGDLDFGDGCDETCAVEEGWTCPIEGGDCSATCGDGRRVGPEACDDGNTAPNDGCHLDCAVELGWACEGAPSVCATTCGDGVGAGAETCDDGDSEAGDGCSATCTVESGYACTGAPSACATACGDAIRMGAEACDDGDTEAGDGCSAACAVETGWTCTGELGAASACTADPVDNPESNDGCDCSNMSPASLLMLLASLVVRRPRRRART